MVCCPEGAELSPGVETGFQPRAPRPRRCALKGRKMEHNNNKTRRQMVLEEANAIGSTANFALVLPLIPTPQNAW
jgi:hypothetical protein